EGLGAGEAEADQARPTVVAVDAEDRAVRARFLDRLAERRGQHETALVPQKREILTAELKRLRRHAAPPREGLPEFGTCALPAGSALAPPAVALRDAGDHPCRWNTVLPRMAVRGKAKKGIIRDLAVKGQ